MTSPRLSFYASSTRTRQQIEMARADREHWAQQDRMAAQSPIDVQCRCGWKGKAPTDLVPNMGTPELLCPACYAVFYPHPNVGDMK